MENEKIYKTMNWREHIIALIIVILGLYLFLGEGIGYLINITGTK